MHGAAGGLAIASGTRVAIHSTDDFSRIALLPLPASGNLKKGMPTAWAEDAEKSWLAFATGPSLSIWSMRSARPLLSVVFPGRGYTRISFGEKDGFLGLKLGVEEDGFIPVAKAGMLDAGELAALRAFAEGLGGRCFAGGNRTLITLTREERLERLNRDLGAIATLFPGADPMGIRDTILALPFIRSGPETWLPLWERLAVGKETDPLRLVRWSSALGKHPWFVHYTRGLIAESDMALLRAWEGKSIAGDAADKLRQLAGDSAEDRELHRLSWQAARCDPESFGKVFGTDIKADDLSALTALKEELQEKNPEDPEIVLLDEHMAGIAAIGKLGSHVSATLEAYEADPSVGNALAHAEALTLAGNTKAAADFLRGKSRPMQRWI